MAIDEARTIDEATTSAEAGPRPRSRPLIDLRGLQDLDTDHDPKNPRLFEELIQLEASGKGFDVTPEYVNFVVHAPMHARVRNELVTQAYGRLAQRLDALLYARVPTSDPVGVHAPNFFCIAHWASAFIGSIMPGAKSSRRMLKTLEDGNAEVFQVVTRTFFEFEERMINQDKKPWERMRDRNVETFAGLEDRAKEWLAEAAGRKMDEELPAVTRVNSPTQSLMRVGSSATVGSLVDPDWGLPQSLIERVSEGKELGAADLLENIRQRGFASYEAAREAPDEESRRAAILRGNAWLIISEQAVVDAALSIALRSLTRRFSGPVRALTDTQRRWRGREISQRRFVMENQAIERLSRRIVWPVPKGILPNAQRRWLGATRGVAIDPFIREHRARLMQRFDALGPPFSDFDDIPDGCHFWPSLQLRLPVIFAVVVASSEDPWFNEYGSFKAAKKWRALDERLRVLSLEIADRGVAR